MAAHPRLSVVMPVHDPDPRDLERAVASVLEQPWPFVELCISDDASREETVRERLDALAEDERVRVCRLDPGRGIAGATNAALELATGDYAVFVDHDDELTPDAFTEIARALVADPSIDFLYSDHDVVDVEGRRLQVHYKPEWSPELLLAYMYIGHVKVVRTSLARRVGGFREGFEGAADHDFALRVGELSERIQRVPRVLYHWRAAAGSMASRSDHKSYAFESGRRAVAEALERRKVTADAEWPVWAQRARVGVLRPVFRGTDDSRVTILIPTRDRLDLLRACIASIESRTTHAAYEIVILDNDSREPDTLAYLEASPHRVLRVPGPFNFSRIVNRGVEAAESEFVLLLNNDTLVVEPEWLGEMLGYARMDGVGAVGAKLLYEDGRIQHAGVTLGVHGLTGHAFEGRVDSHAPLEHGFYAHVARNCSAATAACLLVRRDLYRDVGGFDEEALGVAWNDTDFCLRLRERGLRIVVNPVAELVHRGSASRGDAKNDREVGVMFERWPDVIREDPYYHPALSRLDGQFRPRTRLDEEALYPYAPSGFRPEGHGAAAAAGRSPDALDLPEICRNQAEELTNLRNRLMVLETSGQLVGWLASRPVVGRLARSRRARGGFQRLRGLKHSRLAAPILRRLGLLG